MTKSNMTLEHARYVGAQTILERLSYKSGDHPTDWSMHDIEEVEAAFVLATAYKSYWTDLVRTAAEILIRFEKGDYQDDADMQARRRVRKRVMDFCKKNGIKI